MPSQPDIPSDDWQAVLDRDDEAAFQDLVRPHIENLRRAAQHDLDYYVTQGDLHEHDLTPEEVVGETLIYTWEHRAQRPTDISLLGWLMGTQYRVLRDMVEARRQYRADKAISLDAQIPADAKSQGFQDRRQYGYKPDEVLIWEDVVAGYEPSDIEAPLFTNEDTFHLDPESRHVVMMHDEFDVPLPDIASAMHQAVRDTEALLEQARTSLRERQGEPGEASPPPPESTPA